MPKRSGQSLDNGTAGAAQSQHQRNDRRRRRREARDHPRCDLVALPFSGRGDCDVSREVRENSFQHTFGGTGVDVGQVRSLRFVGGEAAVEQEAKFEGVVGSGCWVDRIEGKHDSYLAAHETLPTTTNYHYKYASDMAISH